MEERPVRVSLGVASDPPNPVYHLLYNTPEAKGGDLGTYRSDLGRIERAFWIPTIWVAIRVYS